MTLILNDGLAAHWSPSQGRSAEAISAQAEQIESSLPSLATRTRKVEEVSRNAGRDNRAKTALTAVSLLLCTGILLSGCAEAPAYAPPAHVYEYEYPAYGSLDFDYWGGWRDWHHDWDHDHDDHGHGEHGR